MKITLSSEETKELEQEQQGYHLVFKELEEKEDFLYQDGKFADFEIYEDDSEFWNIDSVLTSEEARKIFLEKVGKVHYISAHKYVIKYLLMKFKAGSSLNGLGTEIEETLSFLSECLKKTYEENGMETDKNWEKYFKKLIFTPNSKLIKDLALGTKMDYRMFLLFRKKVLKQSEINFFDIEQIYIYLVLKYAENLVGMSYAEAYNKLRELYAEETLPENVKKLDSTIEIREWFEEHLEEDGELKAEFVRTLFSKQDPQIAAVISHLATAKKKDKKRTAEKLFLEQWETLEEYVEKYEREHIIEKRVADKTFKTEKKGEREYSKLSKLEIYRWLYGQNVGELGNNRFIEIKDKDMRLLGNGTDNHFLDSKIFAETRIRNNTFSAFPTDEERQRNLLLTLIFINFAVDDAYLAEDYMSRVTDFETEVYMVFSECGFQMLHSGNAYDAYLKFLLSCDMPMELFKYVWRLKTNSEE